MQQVKVDAIGLQTFEAALAGRCRPATGGIVRINLADDENLIAPTPNGLADQRFGLAFTIHFGGIKQGHAQINTELQGGQLFSVRIAAFTKLPGSHAQCGHFFA